MDSPDEIRNLVKRWRNCLKGHHLPRLNDGQRAIYLWDDPHGGSAMINVEIMSRKLVS
jgi:hypothetical protein